MQRVLVIAIIIIAMFAIIGVYKLILKTGFTKNDFKAIDDKFILNQIETAATTGTKNSMMPDVIESGCGKIDINSATIEELDAIFGIGKKKAKAIVEQRTKMGGFTTLNDIKCTEGIGPETFESIKPYIKITKYSGVD